MPGRIYELQHDISEAPAAPEESDRWCVEYCFIQYGNFMKYLIYYFYYLFPFSFLRLLDASPGYFSLTLDNDIQMEATPTRRAGLERFTFPTSTFRSVPFFFFAVQHTFGFANQLQLPPALQKPKSPTSRLTSPTTSRTRSRAAHWTSTPSAGASRSRAGGGQASAPGDTTTRRLRATTS